MRPEFPQIFTPLGPVDCYIESQSKLTNSQWSWTNRDVKEVKLPEGMEVDGLSAFTLTLTGPSVALKICVSTGSIKHYGKGPESGQFLDTIRIDSDSYALSIGIRDGEYLNAKMPIRLQKKIENELSWISYLKGNFIMEIPNLQSGESLEFPIAVSWRKNPPFDDASTWFAVDLALP